MDHPDADQLNHSQPPEDSIRGFRLPSCVTSWWAPLTSLFFIGLVSGAAGGLVLGGAAVLVLQSLELLAEKKELMDQLGKYLTQDYSMEKNLKEIFPCEHIASHNIHISIFAEIFGILTSSVSLFVGVFIGLSTYALVIKVKGEAAMGKALAVAGSVCLTVVTATGCILGLTLETFLSFTLNINLLLWFFISLSPFLFLAILEQRRPHFLDQVIVLLLIICSTSTVAFITFLLSFFSETRFILVTVFIPLIIAGNSYFCKLPVFIVPCLLNIYDIFYIARWPVIKVQSQASTNISIVLEAIFVGVLTSLWWSVAVGIILFVNWQKGGAVRICATAAALGSAVLGVIKLALPVFGPGPTIGSLMGVAAAAGVSLSAAGAAADQYGEAVGGCGFAGRMGVTVGAAAGVLLSSCTHSGLSGTFMVLCVATVTAGQFFEPGLHSNLRKMFVFLWVCMIFAVVLWTHTSFLVLVSLDRPTRDSIRPLFTKLKKQPRNCR